MMLPRNAVDFCRFMDRVWEMRATATADGGTRLGMHPDYDVFQNALKTARICGMKRSGASLVGKQTGHVFRFPHEMHTGVVIAADGAGFRRELARVYGHRR